MRVLAWNTNSSFTAQGKNDLIKRIESFNVLATNLQAPVAVTGACFLRGGRDSICEFLNSRATDVFTGQSLQIEMMMHQAAFKRYTVISVYPLGSQTMNYQFREVLGFANLHVPRSFKESASDTVQFDAIAKAVRRFEAVIVSTLVKSSF